MRTKLSACLLCLILLFSCTVTAYAQSAEDVYTVAEVENLCDGIVAYKEMQSGAGSVQALIDGYLSDNAGSVAEHYVIALSQRGSYDFGSYERALLRYLDTHEVYSASTREKYALALIASGSTDRCIYDTADEAIGGLGLMSLVFGLHILNNGYPSALYSVDGLISEILSYQLSDGGWAVMGNVGDVDVTAMTIHALAPHYYSRSDVRSAVDAGMDLLSRLQQESGAFQGMGIENCESTAQVLAALSALGIDAQYDERFIKDGHSVLSGMLNYRNADGSFSHTGGGYNESATVQAFYSMVAYLRMRSGQSPLYVLDRADHTPPSRGTAQGSGNPSGNEDHSGGQNSAEDHSDDRADASDRRAAGSSGQNSTKTGAADQKATENTQDTDTPPPSQAETPRATYGGFQPAATADQRIAAADESQGTRGGYKIYAVCGILLTAGGACLILYLLKKRGKKHYLAVAIIAAAGLLFVLLTDFRPADSLRAQPSDGDMTVTLSIRCTSIIDREKVNRYIPDDGVILDDAEFSAESGETVYDVLYRACAEYSIPVDNHGAQGSAYIAGINFLYEFDYGDLSGWMYRVNGSFPDVGCQSFYLHDGDVIEWLYTTNIGKDL